MINSCFQYGILTEILLSKLQYVRLIDVMQNLQNRILALVLENVES